MSRAKADSSPDRAQQMHKSKTLKTRGELFKLPKGHSDVKNTFIDVITEAMDEQGPQFLFGITAQSDYSAETPTKPSGPNVQYENTYKMAPDEDKRFVAFKVEHVMKDILKDALADKTYSPELCSKQTQDLCAKIKDKTKDMSFPRYKLVVQVLIGEDTEQSVQVASRCLWDHNSDNFAAATYRNSSLYAIATVYGLYME